VIVEERNRSIRTILRSVAQLQLGGGLIFRIGPAPNKRFPAVVICTAAQHRPHHSPFSTPRVRNMGSTWDQLWQTRPQLSAKLSPKGPPSCTMLNMTWTSMCTTWLQVQPIWIKLWAQLQPNITPTWAQVGYNIAQLGPKPFLRTQCDTLKTSVLTAISNVFWLQWGFVLCRVPHIGPVLGPASAAVAPLQDPVAQVKPNLRPKLVGANWPEFGASYAQVGPESACVRPNLRPRTPKFDHSQLWLGQVALCSSPCIPNYHAP